MTPAPLASAFVAWVRDQTEWQDPTLDEVLTQADREMYDAKERGRGVVHVDAAEELPA
jgi:GGDEF domain-containing protein